MRLACHTRMQRGAAIVLAMGVVAMAAIAATAIMATQATWGRESELARDHVQARFVAQAAVDWARAVLSDDRRTSSVDHAGEPWALRLPPMSIENGSLTGHIEDQQGLFNLNNLVRNGRADPVQLARYQRLLAVLGLPDVLANSLADWIDSDSQAHPRGGAEDDYYLSLPTPYLAANRTLSDTAELALVRGYDADVLARLRPFVTALPRETAVNVNTAPAEVLAAIIGGLDVGQARALVAQRERAYFRDIADFTNRIPNELRAGIDGITVSSGFFAVTVRVTIGETESLGTALLARDRAGWPDIVWRKYP